MTHTIECPVKPGYDYYKYWKPVENGTQPPDNYQSALMDIVRQGLESGIFYSSDMVEYVKENAAFIPLDVWSLQYPRRPVENGLMGMEIFSARKAITEAENREAYESAKKIYTVGSQLGTLCVNGKRYTNISVIDYDDYGRCVLSGKAGKYSVTFSTQPQHITAMIERATQRNWRKS